jgi:ABC-2 type transport system ATP-binding protein
VTNAVEFHAVTRTFARSNALDDVSFAVPEGSICGLLGRNGAGKTTMMSIIAGQDRPTSGRVEVFGKHPFENESTLAKINFVRDDQRYPDGYKLLHVLRIAPAFAPNWDADVAAELADGFRIPTRTPIKKFSRGQLSSVAIILGLASRAPLTLLDEPYLGLDITARRLFHDVLLRDYTTHPRTIVLSTHLIEESEALFDRVVIVDRGRIRADSVIDEIPDLAFTLTGSSDGVDRLTANRMVLRSHHVGGLKSVTVRGPADEQQHDDARRLGVELAPVSLQDLVAALGEDAPEVATKKTDHVRKGARA